jgi:hypothetical protein
MNTCAAIFHWLPVQEDAVRKTDSETWYLSCRDISDYTNAGGCTIDAHVQNRHIP